MAAPTLPTRSRAAATAVLLLHAAALWALFSHDSLPRAPQGTMVYLEMVAVPSPQERAGKPRKVAIERPVVVTPRRTTAPAQASTQAAEPAAAPEPIAATSNAPLPDPFASEPRRLDVDAMRKLARADEHRRTPTPLERVQDSQRIRASGDSDTARAIVQAKRPDCKKASGESTSFNIFGLIPLAYATLTDTGCKW